ncbi:hypothetical protein EDD99_0924 [Streptomyces sp. 846.5]|nr:hypothetical protein [Streptomyces sp. 846.5]TDU02526.1 hypothetical protein EDD99_0924 [Streptomyces sp. 846.5]
MTGGTSGADGLEALLGEVLRSRAQDAPSAAPLLASVHARVSGRMRSRRRYGLAAVAAAVAVTAGASVLTVPGFEGGGAAGRPASSGDLGAMLAWNYHGLQVEAPKSWAVNATHCGTPVRDTVVTGGTGANLCAVLAPPRVQHVAFGAPTQFVMPPTHHAVSVSGQPGILGSEVLPNGSTREVLTLPALHTAVEVETDTPALAGSIIASARLVTIDRNGCASTADPISPAATPSRPGAAQQLVPGQPNGAVLCFYGSGGLEHSTVLDPRRLTKLVTLFNALRPGLASGAVQSPDMCTLQQASGYVVRLSYPTGPGLDVHLRLAGCTRLGADNGASTGRLTQEFGTTFFKDLDPLYGGQLAAGIH